MKFEEIKNKTLSETFEMINGLKKQLLTLRFQKSMNQLSDTSQFKKVRKQIAQLHTHLSSQNKVRS